MANSVINVLRINADKETVKKIIDFTSSEKEDIIDFNKIMPVPDELFLTSNLIIGFDVRKYVGIKNNKSLSESNKETLHEIEERYKNNGDKFSLYMNLFKKYNAFTKNEWKQHNWGTDWLAQSYLEGNEIWLYTGWTMPDGIFQVISEKFPDVDFDFESATEDVLSNCPYGSGTIKDGHFSWNEYSTTDCQEHAIKLWNLEDYYAFVNGEWTCKDDMEDE